MHVNVSMLTWIVGDPIMSRGGASYSWTIVPMEDLPQVWYLDIPLKKTIWVCLKMVDTAV